ncbi:MAG: hypothetical protein U0Q12_01155 [Vicinamibacterales bacterium]
MPYHTFEGDVEDVSHQHIANRASSAVHPAPCMSVSSGRRSSRTSRPDSTAIVTFCHPTAVGGVFVTLTLSQVCGTACGVRRAVGFAAWDTRREEQEVAHWTVT